MCLPPFTFVFVVLFFPRPSDLCGGLRQTVTLTANVQGGAVCGAELTQTAVFNRRRDTALSVVLNIYRCMKLKVRTGAI